MAGGGAAGRGGRLPARCAARDLHRRARRLRVPLQRLSRLCGRGHARARPAPRRLRRVLHSGRGRARVSDAGAGRGPRQARRRARRGGAELDARGVWGRRGSARFRAVRGGRGGCGAARAAYENAGADPCPADPGAARARPDRPRRRCRSAPCRSRRGDAPITPSGRWRSHSPDTAPRRAGSRVPAPR